MNVERALLVDLDGTLTDNFIGISRSIRHALAALGAPDVDALALRSCVGPPLRETFARLLACDDRSRIEHAIACYRERFGDIGWQENVCYEGIAGTLAALRARHRTMFVCTSKPQPYAELVVEKFALGRYFDGVYGVDLAGTLDDKATLVAHVIASEALHAPRCAMIGDRAHDVRAAHAHRMPAIGVLWGYGTRTELEDAGADAIVATPQELVPALERLQ